jgi:beta-N-acetylhexosaminidase
LLLGVPGPELAPETAALYRRIQPAGFVLFARNLVSPRQTRRLTDELRGLCQLEPVIAIDQEGGRVSRTRELAPAVPAPAALVAHAKHDRHVIAKVGAATGELLRMLGINVNFAPVLDLDHHPQAANALHDRCWSRDPQRVIDHAGIFNRWQRKRGIRACAKHFPAGGRATADPHHSLPACSATLAELHREDILPYTALMPELDGIMTAHVRFPNIDPEFPASFSHRIIEQFLRRQLGFDHHLVLTDDLDMGAVTGFLPRGPDCVAAIRAGNDLAMIGHRVETADAALAALKALPSHQIDDSLDRIERFRLRLCGPSVWSDDRWHTICSNITNLIPPAGTL